MAMRRVLGVVLAFALFAMTSSFGADAPDAAATPPTAGPATPGATPAAAGQSWNGSLTMKPLSSKDGVVALMEITTGDKVEWVDLRATGDAAKKLDDLASQHARVTVTGTRNADGITVISVGDDAKIPPSKKKKKK